MLKETWSLYYRRALAAGMDDASACHAADEAVAEIKKEDRTDVWRETLDKIYER